MNVVELQNKSNETIIQKVWLPVGTLYYNQNDISEDIKRYFYGTWERAKGFFAVAVDEDDSDFVEGKTGGEKTHKLTVNEMPSHSHNIVYSNNGKFIQFGTGGNNYNLQWGSAGFNGGAETIAASTGGGQAHNNLPPYKSFYAWIRVS